MKVVRFWKEDPEDYNEAVMFPDRVDRFRATMEAKGYATKMMPDEK